MTAPDLDSVGIRHREYTERKLAARMNGIRALEIHDAKERRKTVATAKICDISGKIIKGEEPLAPGFIRPGMFEQRFTDAGAPAVMVTVTILKTTEPAAEGGLTTDFVMTDVHPDSGKKVVGAALAKALKLLEYRKPRRKVNQATGLDVGKTKKPRKPKPPPVGDVTVPSVQIEARGCFITVLTSASSMLKPMMFARPLTSRIRSKKPSYGSSSNRFLSRRIFSRDFPSYLWFDGQLAMTIPFQPAAWM